MQDAYILARILTHPITTQENIPLALKAYDSVRRERTQAIQELSWRLGRLTCLMEDLNLEPGADKYAETARRLKEAGTWVNQGSMEDDVQRAVQNFQKLLAEQA